MEVLEHRFKIVSWPCALHFQLVTFLVDTWTNEGDFCVFVK